MVDHTCRWTWELLVSCYILIVIKTLRPFLLYQGHSYGMCTRYLVLCWMWPKDGAPLTMLFMLET